MVVMKSVNKKPRLPSLSGAREIRESWKTFRSQIPSKEVIDFLKELSGTRNTTVGLTQENEPQKPRAAKSSDS